MSASAASSSTFADIGPCSAKAAVCSEMSSMVTSSAKAFCRNHRRLGSAAVQRYSFSPSRVIVPSSITLPSGSHQQRSEEHTSELQSLTNLVCRLLLEKK